MGTTKSKRVGAAGRKPALNSTAPDNGKAAGGDGPASLLGYRETVRLNQDAVEAVLRAGTVVAEGWRDAGLRLMALTQETIEDGLLATKALSGAKSLHDVIQCQARLVQDGLDRFVREGVKFSEMGTKVAEEAFAPISGSVSAVMSRWVNPAA